MAESTPPRPGRSICKEFTKLDGGGHIWELEGKLHTRHRGKSTLRPVADLGRHHTMKDFGHCGLNSDGLLEVYARELYDFSLNK